MLEKFYAQKEDVFDLPGHKAVIEWHEIEVSAYGNSTQTEKQRFFSCSCGLSVRFDTRDGAYAVTLPHKVDVLAELVRELLTAKAYEQRG